MDNKPSWISSFWQVNCVQYALPIRYPLLAIFNTDCLPWRSFNKNSITANLFDGQKHLPTANSYRLSSAPSADTLCLAATVARAVAAAGESSKGWNLRGWVRQQQNFQYRWGQPFDTIVHLHLFCQLLSYRQKYPHPLFTGGDTCPGWLTAVALCQFGDFLQTLHSECVSFAWKGTFDSGGPIFPRTLLLWQFS